jgi:hypothetical protein
MGQAGGQGRFLAEISGKIDDRDMAPLLFFLHQPVKGVIRAAVIHADDFKRPV